MKIHSVNFVYYSQHFYHFVKICAIKTKPNFECLLLARCVNSNINDFKISQTKLSTLILGIFACFSQKKIILSDISKIDSCKNKIDLNLYFSTFHEIIDNM